MNLLSLPSFIRGPAFLRRRDILLLPLLRAAANENHKALAILAEVDAGKLPMEEFLANAREILNDRVSGGALAKGERWPKPAKEC